MSLSPREQRILAGIENELGRKDPALAASLGRARPPSSFWLRSPLSGGHACWLVLALLVLAALHSAAVELGATGSGILTVLLIVPWMVSAVRSAARRCGQDAPKAMRIRSAAQALSRWRGK